MKYFSKLELACKGSGIVLLAEGFEDKLVELREAYARPMYVNSCCRSLAHNITVGGHPKSSHIYDHPKREFKGTYGIDIRMKNSADRAELILLALQLGWCVGVNKTFLHLDRRRDYFPTYPQVVFLY
jgi:hypothetical protein